MHDCMQYDLIQGQGQGHEPLTVGNPFIFKSYFLRYFQWELATDHGFWNQGTISKFSSGQICDIFPGFCVTWLWPWQKHQLWRVDRQSPHGANFSFMTLLSFLYSHPFSLFSLANTIMGTF